MNYSLPEIKDSLIKTPTGSLLVFEPENNSLNIFDWLQRNTKNIEEILLKIGGILFRNFNIHAVSEFNKFAQIMCPDLQEYVYRSTPRTRLGGKIYTATEYPAEQTIPLHNENAYARSWPSKILFCSILIASEGGETSIADSRRVYEKIDPQIRKKFEEKKVLYVRNYRPGVDLSWQEVFQTDKKEEVGEYCKNHEIEMAWQTGAVELTTKQVCQATLSHPITGEKVWFNQAHLFHVTSLGKEMSHSLLKEFGKSGLPRNAFYGDGSPLEESCLDHIREVYNQEKIKFKWQKGDIMLLDNILMAHGREPYKGERKVVVAMA